jgi:hypothetical protein
MSPSGTVSTKFIHQLWAPLRPTFGTDLLFGLAGLVLIPLAGAWLGYRQARAARESSATAHLVDR